MAAVTLSWGANMAAVTSCEVGDWSSYLPWAFFVGQPFMSDDGNTNDDFILCGWESLCDIRRDCCHHFVSERDFKFGRDARRVCPAERSLTSPLAEMNRASSRTM